MCRSFDNFIASDSGEQIDGAKILGGVQQVVDLDLRGRDGEKALADAQGAEDLIGGLDMTEACEPGDGIDLEYIDPERERVGPIGDDGDLIHQGVYQIVAR